MFISFAPPLNFNIFVSNFEASLLMLLKFRRPQEHLENKLYPNAHALISEREVKCIASGQLGTVSSTPIPISGATAVRQIVHLVQQQGSDPTRGDTY